MGQGAPSFRKYLSGNVLPLSQNASHCGVKVPSRSRAAEKLVESPMETDFMEAFTTSMEVNPTVTMDLPCLPSKVIKTSAEVAGRFHGTP